MQMRKPKPRKSITTLRELVLDLDERLEGGDTLCDVWLPHEEWTQLVERAVDEEHATPVEVRPIIEFAKAGAVQPVFCEHEADIPCAACGCPSGTALAAAELRIKELEADQTPAEGQRVQARIALARELGWGTMNGFDDLLQVVRGYMLALDAERARSEALKWSIEPLLKQRDQLADKLEAQRLALADALESSPRASFEDLREVASGYAQALVLEGERAQSAEETALALAAGPDNDGADDEPEHPTCPTCGEADGHAPEDCANAGWAAPTTSELAAEAGRRLNGAGWRRAAKQARAENALDACHHCGTDEEDDELLTSKNDPVLPDGTFCAGCRVRLTEKPSEWQPGPTMVESLERAEVESAAAKKRGQPKGDLKMFEDGVCTRCGADFDQHMSTPGATTAGPFTCPEPAKAKARAPGRPTKKFPKGGSDPLEKCTSCSRELGEHDGTKCPPATAPKKRRMLIKDDEQGGKEVPF